MKDTGFALWRKGAAATGMSLLLALLSSFGMAACASRPPVVDAPPPAPAAAPSAAPAATATVAEPPPKQQSEARAYRLGNRFGFGTSFAQMKQQELFQKSLLAASILTEQLSVTFPRGVGMRRAGLAVADQLNQRYGPTVGHCFLVGVTLADEFLTTHVFPEADLRSFDEHGQRLTELGAHLNGSGVEPAVWQAQYRKLMAHPTTANVVALESAFAQALGVDGDIVHDEAITAKQVHAEMVGYTKRFKEHRD
jgi:hypothetical protein